MKKIAIGLDLGTTSVGWSILEFDEKGVKEEKFNIIDMGVRLFDDPATNQTSNVQERRESRGRRRRINRLKIRKKDFFYLLLKNKIVKNDEEFRKFIESSFYDENEERFLMPVEIKIKGLEGQLSKHEIVLILHNYLKHRGNLNLFDLSEEEEKEEEKISSMYDKNKFPCENQFLWFLSSGKVIGNKTNSLISNEDYIKEIKQILSNQKESGIDKKFIEDFINIFKRHRLYFEGPGSENSPTKYGRFRREIVNGEEKLIWQGKDSNLWDLLVGKCTYYPDKIRNYKKSPITEIFNILNDLSNLKIKNENQNNEESRYLSLEEKKEILTLPFDKLTLDKILKSLGLTKLNIHSGLRRDKKDNWEIEKLESTRAILKWLSENNIKKIINLSNIDDLLFLHNIYCVGVKKQNQKERFETFKKEKENLNIECNEIGIENLSKLKIFSPGTSSLSKEAQIDFIKYATTNKESVGKNQMIYFTIESEHREKVQIFNKYKYFPENFFKDEIMSSTVKRTFNQAVKIINHIIKRYKNEYELSHIIIELARELNSEEEKERIKKELKNNEKILKQKLDENDLTIEDIKKGENRIKFLLWCQQNRQDIYDGEEINLKDLLNNPTKYHIDHVLPISISFIDSMQNKVLTKSLNNENKGDKTPYQWLSSIGKFKEYEERCIRLLNEVQDKKQKQKLENKINNYLLYKADPFSNLTGFVERQLNDTRYISRELSNQLKTFFSQSEEWKNKKIIIQPVNGSITTFARRNLFDESDCENRLMFKNRDIYNHHAIDASIIAYLGLNQKIQNLLKMKSKEIVKLVVDGKDSYIDINSGEVLAEKHNFFKDEKETSKYFRNQMREFLDKSIKSKTIKFSRMKISKENITLSNDTLYSLRNINGKDYKITKLNLLDASTTKEQLEKYFGLVAKEKENLLIYENDRIIYEKLNNIFLDSQYNKKEFSAMNPFQQYINSTETMELAKKINRNFDFNLQDKILLFNKELTKITHWIKFLKIKENEIKDKDDYLILKKHASKAFYDSLKPIAIRVYKTYDDKYKTIFINALNVKWDSINEKMIVDEEKLASQLKKYNIDSSKGYLVINKGTTIINGNDLYYFVGGGNWKQNKLEIKSIMCKNEIAHNIVSWENAPARDQWQISISTIIENFKLCSVDPLGKTYNVQTFDEYFKKIKK